MTRLSLTGAALLILTAVAIASGYYGLSTIDDPTAPWSFRLAIALSIPVYFAAVALVRRGVAMDMKLVLGLAIGLRLLLLIAHPMLSSDLYRYVWDGRVQMAGINPYLFVPADEALHFLRDAAIYPNMNRPNYAHTIYPPAAQMFFAAVAAIAPTLTGLRVAVSLLDVGAIWALLKLLDSTRQSRMLVLIYAWNPLVLWEFSNNAHIDALAVLLLLLAVLLATAHRPMWAGLALGMAVVTKFLPAIVAPALWRLGKWRAAIAAALSVVTLYAIYASWDHAGWQVLGFLGQYRQEEALDSGSGYWLLAVLGSIATLPGWAATLYMALAATGLAALSGVIAFRIAPDDALAVCRASVTLILALLLVLSPHYAWYYAWLAAFAAITPSRAAVFLSAAALLLYQQTLPDHVLLPSLVFAPTLFLIAADLRAPRLLGAI